MAGHGNALGNRDNTGETCLCKKVSPRPPSKNSINWLAGRLPRPGKPASQHNIEVFGEGCGEEPSYKKVLAAISALESKHSIVRWS